MAVLTALALSAAVSLVVLATYFHRAAGELGSAIESVRLAEAVQVDLLTHSHLHVPGASAGDLARRRLEGDLRQRMAQMRAFSGSDAEAQLIHTMEAQVDQYLAASRASADADARQGGLAVDRALDAAVEAVEHVVALNVEQARTVQGRAARWDTLATFGGSAAAVALLGGVAGVLIWLRGVFRPVLDVSKAMRRFAAGDRSVRAPEKGPAELLAVSRTFNEMAATLQRQREAQLAFLGGVAHDLRSPLSTLKLTAATVAADRPLPSEAELRGLFQRVERQVNKLDRMVEDLLDAARMEAGRLSLELRPCDVREIVAEVIDQQRPAAPAHRIEVSLPADPVPVRCDSIRLEQVLGNLVGNAIKYSPGGGRVQVDVSSAAGRATLSVADQGLGISAEDRPHIFEPFRRGSRHEGVPGMGLGLWVARRIVEAHGGVLEVESAPGAGAVFHVRLPTA